MLRFITSSTPVEMPNSFHNNRSALQFSIAHTSVFTTYLTALLVFNQQFRLFVLHVKKRKHFRKSNSCSDAGALIRPAIRVVTWGSFSAYLFRDMSSEQRLKKNQGLFFSIDGGNAGKHTGGVPVACASAESCCPLTVEKASSPRDINNTRKRVRDWSIWSFMFRTRRSFQKYLVRATCSLDSPVVRIAKTIATHWFVAIRNNTWFVHVYGNIVLITERLAFGPGIAIRSSTKDRLCFWSGHSNHYTGVRM